MQVTENAVDGLKRELQIVVPAGELDAQLRARVDELKGTIRLKGFRPGKVPAAHLRKVYGKSLMSEVIQKTVSETSQKAMTDRAERPAFQPDIEFTEDEKEIEKVIGGKADLAYTMKFEILPEVKLCDLAALALEKLVAEVADEDIQKSLDSLVDASMTFEASEGAGKNGDQLRMDFVGRIDGEEFEGGSADDMDVVLGRNQFIPGFEEQLVGASAGDTRQVKVTFPQDYHADQFAGKDAEFDVTVKLVSVPVRPGIDDAFAEKVGFDDVAKLREAVSDRLRSEHDGASREKLKGALLDTLDDAHDFELPPTLVENEFKGIWEQVRRELEQSKKSFEDEGTTEDAARQKYQKLAERRVRLGLVIAEIGEKNEISVSDEELGQAVSQQARQYPGQEKMVYEHFSKNPQALLQMRGPIFEDKVVDFALELAKVTEKTVTTEELYKPDEDEDADEDAEKDKDAAAL